MYLDCGEPLVCVRLWWYASNVRILDNRVHHIEINPYTNIHAYIPLQEHRVLIPKKEVQLRSSRKSIAYFLSPDDDLPIKPLDSSADYPAITFKQHLLDRYAKTYQY